MKHIRLMGLCLVAGLAMGMITTTAAYAGIIKESGPGEECWKSEGKEVCAKWSKDVEFIEKAGSAQLKTPGNVFTGVEFKGVKCHSTGAKEGEVKTNGLTETFGFINKTKLEVGLEIKPTVAGEAIANYTCGETTIETKGAVIGSITPVNTLITPEEHFTQEFTQKEGTQSIKKFEGGPEVGLEVKINGAAAKPSAIKDPSKLIPAETAEIKTSPTLEFT